MKAVALLLFLHTEQNQNKLEKFGSFLTSFEASTFTVIMTITANKQLFRSRLRVFFLFFFFKGKGRKLLSDASFTLITLFSDLRHNFL